jgi:hypothetical protein
MDHQTVKALGQARAGSCQGHLGLWDDHAQPDRHRARMQVRQRYDHGWHNGRLSQYRPVSRPTVDAWGRRFEAAHCAGVVDTSRAPHTPARTGWLPLMVQVYHRQKAHPDAGRFRLWSLLARSDLSARTVGRIMALNTLVDHDIPHVPTPGVKPTPRPHPYTPSYRQQSWFIDGRRMDVAVEGVRWWSLIILEGDSRTLLAGMIAPTEATWVALMVL